MRHLNFFLLQFIVAQGCLSVWADGEFAENPELVSAPKTICGYMPLLLDIHVGKQDHFRIAKIGQEPFVHIFFLECLSA